MPVPQKEKSRKFTYGDYTTWPEEERCELIEGITYDMTPAPSRTHSLITNGFMKQFFAYFEGKSCEVHDAPFDVRLPKGKEPDDKIETVVQPDILVVCDRAKLDEKGCRGAPDLIVEILSPSTASKDCIQKRRLYEKHGVKELFIVDPINRLVQVYILEKKGIFKPVQMFAEDDRFESATFPGLKIDLAKVFPRLPKIVRESPQSYQATPLEHREKEAQKMEIPYVFWQDGEMWLGYLQEFPDYMSQGRSLEELQENLKDLHLDLSSGKIPCARRISMLKVA